MPYSIDNPPDRISGLPKHAKEIWIAAFNAALKEYDDEGRANQTAYAAVKKAGYAQDKDGKWHKVNAITQLFEDIKRLFEPHLIERTEYLPTVTRSLTITRADDGTPRWLLIAASAVVNKVNAIDSTTLFDNFIRHAQETGEYPAMDFLHQENNVRFGVADWLARDGALYLASGTFEDTDLARAAIAGLEKEADYWGASISYRITQPPLMLVAEGEIPVYTDGVNNFISIVPKRMAANLFTAAQVTKEVVRMDKKTFDELVRLVGPAAAQQFADQVDDTNRTITDTGMVTRADETATQPAEVVAVTQTAPPADVVTRPDVPADAPPADAAPKVTLEELAAKVEALAEKLAALEGMGAMVEESKRVMVEENKRAVTELAELRDKLAGVEASKARWDQWLDDAPEYMKADANLFRARNQPAAQMTMTQVAEQSLSKMHRGPHERPGK